MGKMEEVGGLGATQPWGATSKGLNCQEKFAAPVRGAASSRKRGSRDGPVLAQTGSSGSGNGSTHGSSALALSSLLSESLG